MVIKKYGLELREVLIEHLEMIRQHRNSSVIQNNMIYREKITMEEQSLWFKKIQDITSEYFVIYKNDVAMGLINGKNIDHHNKTSEGGIFVWTEMATYDVTILASIILNDWNFGFNKFKLNFAEVLKSNKKAIAYNQFMGYEISGKEHSNPKVIWMEQTAEAYWKFRQKVVDLELIDFDITKILSVEDLEIKPYEIEQRKKIVQLLPKEQQKIYLDLMDKHRL